MPVLTKDELNERVDAGLEAFNKAIIVTEKVNVSRAHFVGLSQTGHENATQRLQRAVRSDRAALLRPKANKKTATGALLLATWRSAAARAATPWQPPPTRGAHHDRRARDRQPRDGARRRDHRDHEGAGYPADDIGHALISAGLAHLRGNVCDDHLLEQLGFIRAFVSARMDEIRGRLLTDAVQEQRL